MDETSVVLRFIAAVNAGAVDALAALMTDDHTLQVFGEPPLVGLAANVEGWRGYCQSFPRYRIHVHRVAEQAGTVAVLGHTTGSHLALSDDEEARETLIWLAEIGDGCVRTWQLLEDTVGNRLRAGLASEP
jgi:ketosteroid isomerase-like protein